MHARSSRSLATAANHLHAVPDRVSPSGDPERAVFRFVDTLEPLLADPETSRGLAAAGVHVRLDFSDAPDCPVHLLFANHPVSVSRAAQRHRPEVVLTLTTDELDGFLTGGEELPLRILNGSIRFEGTVRKLLRVLPILRAAAAKP